MKKNVALCLLLWGASSLYAQTSMTLDNAILDSADFFSSKITSGSTVAIINFEAETQNLSNFVIEELLIAFANTGNIRVVERSRLAILQSELNFNMSGAVSDETAQGIGRMVGAQVLFSGSIVPYRDIYRMRVQAVAVETAEIIGTRTINVRYDPTLTGLLGRINPADQWKYQWFYVEINVGYSAKTISSIRGEENPYYYFENVPFGYGINLMVQPFDLFGIALDLGGNMYEGPILSILPTLTIRPSKFEVDIFFGAGWVVLPTSYGIGAILGGARIGLNVGPGVLFAEVRPMVPIGYNSYYAFFINATMGYQIGFIPKKK